MPDDGTLSFEEFAAQAEEELLLTEQQYAETLKGEPFLTEEEYKKSLEPKMTGEEYLRSLIPPTVPGKTGPRGPRGVIGPIGPQGSVGPAGASGSPGVAGVRGPMGRTGPQGEPGVPGPEGKPGIQGVPGVKGDTGPQGEQGSKGDPGVRGFPGSDGKDGATGPRGARGPEGPEGKEGPQGKPGDNAIPMTIGFGPDEAAPGNHWHHMPESKHARRHSLRQNIDPIFPMHGTVDHYVLEYNSGSPNLLAWVAQTGGTGGGGGSVGPQGPQGIQGPPGLDGIDGQDGADGQMGIAGPQGATGTQGIQGVQGIQGPAGVDGAIGANGAQGPPGFDGQDGLDGSDGPPGPSGSQGIQGVTGAQGIQGVAGANGATGAIGPQGVQGFPGLDGQDGQDGEQGPPGSPGVAGAAGTAGSQGLAGIQGSPGVDGVDGVDGFDGAPGRPRYIHDEVSAALAQLDDVHFMGAGIKAQQNAGRIEVVAGAYYDSIVDAQDTNAVGKGNVYSTIQAAISAGRKSIFVRNASDASDIVISSDNATDSGTTNGNSATILSDASKTWVTDQWKNHTLHMGALTAVALSNNPTNITHGGWSDGSTPAASVAYTIDSLSTSGNVDVVTRIVGENLQTSLCPVNVTCWNADVLFDSLFFRVGGANHNDPTTGVATRLILGGTRDIAFACGFAGTLTSKTAVVNIGNATKNIVSSTNATPIVVTVTGHGYANGDGITIAGHTVNTNANGTWKIANVAANTFELVNSVGNGVGGATGTSRKDMSATQATVAYNASTWNGGSPRGVAIIDNEIITIAAGGGGTSNTLTLTTRTAYLAGNIETLNESHADASTISLISDGYVVINAADCQLLQCRFVACDNNKVQCIYIRKTGDRTRLTANVFLANSTWACVAIDPEDADTTAPIGISLIGNTFATNTCYSSLVETWNATGDGSSGYIRSVSINGNLFRGFDGGAIRMYGAFWNISGNTFDGITKSTRASTITCTATDTKIAYTLTGVGTMANKGSFLVESEEIYYSAKDASFLYGCIRGINGTTAAVHTAKTATFYSQRAIFHAGVGDVTLGLAAHVVSGNSFSNMTVVLNSEDGTTGYFVPKFLLTGNAMSVCTYLFGVRSSVYADNFFYGSMKLDFRSRLTQVLIGGMPPVLVNIASDTAIFIPGSTAVGLLTFPASSKVGLGRTAGDSTIIGVPLLNKTGAGSVIGNVVVPNAALANSFIHPAGANAANLLGVIVENAVADGTSTLVAVGGVYDVNGENAGAIAVGDILVAAATAGTVKTNNLAIFNTMLGVALTAKAAATTATVKVLIQPR